MVRDELMNYGSDANRDIGVHFEYGEELMELLASRFRVIELILGQEDVAHYLLAMLHGPNDGGDTWSKFFANYDPTMTPHWNGTKLVDNAGLYGLYGVTTADVPLEARKSWVDTLAQELGRFRQLAQPDQGSVIARIVNLALSHHAIDSAEGEVDLQSLARSLRRRLRGAHPQHPVKQRQRVGKGRPACDGGQCGRLAQGAQGVLRFDLAAARRSGARGPKSGFFR